MTGSSDPSAGGIDRRLRILELLEPRDGGVAEHVRLLAEGLHARDVHVEIAGPPGARSFSELVRCGVPVRIVPGLVSGFSDPGADARAVGAVMRILARGRYDLVHCHSAKAGVLGRLAAPWFRLPVVFSPHSFSFVGDFSSRRRRFATVVEQGLDPWTSELVCVCRQERELARVNRLRSPATIVHNGVRDPQEMPADADVARFAAGGPLVASIAALRPQKTVEVFLDAVPEILRRVPDARVAVIGNGPERERLVRHAASLGLDGDDRFRFFAFSGPSGRYLQLLDLYVLPSSWEALPIGVLEAQAWGVPQVATDVGGTREAVDAEVGALVAPRDPSALAGAVVTLLENPVRRQAASAASRRRHTERFTVDRMVEGVLAVYRRAAGRAVAFPPGRRGAPSRGTL